MSIRHLKTLITIADKGSFIDAADTVFITQAAVSMQMKTLEEDLGLTIFDRSHRPPILNDAGLALIPKAREIVHRYEQFMETSAISDEMSGHLSVGAVPTMLTGALPKALVNLKDSFPKLHIKITSELSNTLINQVERGSIDVAITSEPPSERPGLRWYEFDVEPLILIAPIESEATTAKEFLANYPFIRFSKNAWVGQKIENFLEKENIAVEETMELTSLESVTTMVYYGLGVSIIPDQKNQYPGNLAVKRIPLGNAPPSRRVGLIERGDSPKSIFTKELLRELKK